MFRQLIAVASVTVASACFAKANTGIDHLDVGASLPPATLLTAEGREFDLQASTAGGPAVLIFYRGGWCPYCNAHLADLMEIEDDLRGMGVQLLAISPDRPGKLHDAPKREQKLAYTLLSDQDMALADALGISFRVEDDLVAKYKNDYNIDLEDAAGRKHHKLPHPAVFVVGPDGMIHFAHVNPDYKDRLAPEKILEAARAVARE